MAKKISHFEMAAGKLISAIQKEWNKESSEPEANFSEEVMYTAHNLLQARTADSARILLEGSTLRQYLGEVWISQHPDVLPAVERMEAVLKPYASA